MKPNDALKYTDVLLNHAFDLLYLRDYGVNHAEHIFVEILSVIKNVPAVKNGMLYRIEISLSGKYEFPQKPEIRPKWFVPEEFIEFVAYALRWEELRELALKRQRRLFGKDLEFRSTDASDLILAAFSDSWEDKEMYQIFRQTQ